MDQTPLSKPLQRTVPGTRRLTLREIAATVKQARPEPAPPVEPVERYSLLVVEDDPTIAYALEYMLGREGFEVHAAADGRQAMDLIDQIEPPSLVLLDLMLPHYDGFQLIDHMRGKPAWARTPIVMLTSNSQERDIVRALNAGANDYVTKPFQLLELVARLRRFCRQYA